MKRALMVLLVCGLVATWAGCEASTDPGYSSGSGTTGVSQGTSSSLTLVTLKVPNMV